MAANQAPIFVLTPHVESASIATANTNRDGTGTIATFFTATANGSRIDRIQVKATGTTTAGMVRIFEYNGTAYRLIGEVNVSAITPSATVQTFEGAPLSSLFPLVLPTGHSLVCSTHNAETFHVTAFGGDY